MNTLPIDLLKIISKYKDQIEHLKKFKKSLNVIKSINCKIEEFSNSRFKLSKTFYYVGDRYIIKHMDITRTGSMVYSFDKRGVLYMVICSEHGLIIENMEED